MSRVTLVPWLEGRGYLPADRDRLAPSALGLSLRF